MNQPIRTFRLAEEIGAGLSCDETGLFLGEAPLLERDPAQGWRARPLAELNAAAGEAYRLPVDFGAKLEGLRTVAGALNRGETALARIAALQLRLPDPPPLGKRAPSQDALVDLVLQLQAAGLLAKILWDESKHPRWPAGSPNSVGGEFAPAGEGGAPDAAAAAAPKKHRHQAAPQKGSPLATSLQRKLRSLSPSDKKLLDALQANLKDPSNQGVVWFDHRDEALKDMGAFFSADITRYDVRTDQYERGAWLFHDPVTGRWFYDRSEMQVAMASDSKISVSLRGTQEIDAYRAGNAISVHIHPIIWNQAPGRTNAAADNEANRTLSKPSAGDPGDAGHFAIFSKENGVPLHAAVIGSDGSISYWDGGERVEDYEDKMRVVVAPRGTIPMVDPNH
jgi:hypothetical protein